MSQRDPRDLGSLRRRLTVLAAVIVVFMLLASIWGYRNLLQTQGDAASNLEARNILLAAGHRIRAQVVEAYKSLDLFVLEPTREAHRVSVHTALDTAIATANTLQESDWGKANRHAENVKFIAQRLVQLRDEADELFATRLDTTRQYPSMSIGNDVMQPNRNNVNNAFALAFNELDTENVVLRNPTLYAAFLRSRRLWTQALSNFRLYLANRMGSFNEEALPIQERGIHTLFSELSSSLDDIAAYEQRGELGFEASAALADIRASSRAWYDGFRQVETIHQSDEWRIDAKLMKSKIAPSVDAINSALTKLENEIGATVENDLRILGAVAQRQTLFLWLVAGLGVGFIVVVLLSTNRLVFLPIAAVAKALKAEAMSKTQTELPISHASETRDLVEAFSEMQRLIHIRQSELEYRALHDTLTALPNRALLFDHIEHDIRLSQRSSEPLSLLMIDLDRFKEINDTLGHQIGDRLLIEVGNRFQRCLREADTVARLGGDEFAVLLPATDSAQAEIAAQKILDALREPILIDELKLFAAASIGIALYPQHGADAPTLLQHADVAMYVAKRNQTGYARYDPDQDEYSIARLALVNELRQAVEQGQLDLAYQPLLAVASGKTVGVEALLRWHHPAHGPIPPDLIIDLAEQSGIMGPLTALVLDMALRQTRSWHDEGLMLNVAVNLSMRNLHDDRLDQTVAQALEKHGLSGDALTLEVTESAMMSNPRQVIDTLHKLDRMNVRLAVDDFGTGFSSLSYLKQLPVDELKIDKSFVMDMDHDRSDHAIVKATLNLAHNLELEVVAEGVESEAVWRLLSELGCDFAQGYFASKPLPANELRTWLQAHDVQPLRYTGSNTM